MLETLLLTLAKAKPSVFAFQDYLCSKWIQEQNKNGNARDTMKKHNAEHNG